MAEKLRMILIWHTTAVCLLTCWLERSFFNLFCLFGKLGCFALLLESSNSCSASSMSHINMCCLEYLRREVDCIVLHPIILALSNKFAGLIKTTQNRCFFTNRCTAGIVSIGNMMRRSLFPRRFLDLYFGWLILASNLGYQCSFSWPWSAFCIRIMTYLHQALSILSWQEEVSTTPIINKLAHIPQRSKLNA